MNLNKDQNNKETDNIKQMNADENKMDEQSIKIEDKYKFGWSGYSEITNGRFAMIGFLAIILIEIFSQKSFLQWTGLF